MLNRDPAVTFKYGFGAQARTLRCEWVRYGIELIGDVVEDINYELREDYQGVIGEGVEDLDGNARQTIRLKVMMRVSDALWMGKFLASTSKILEIDGNEIPVVNAEASKEFDLITAGGDQSNFAVSPVFRFRAKSLGLVSMSDPAGYLGGSPHG